MHNGGKLRAAKHEALGNRDGIRSGISSNAGTPVVAPSEPRVGSIGRKVITDASIGISDESLLRIWIGEECLPNDASVVIYTINYIQIRGQLKHFESA
jgi:hypothetical protein